MRRFAAVLSSFLLAVIFVTPSLPSSAACPVVTPVPLRGLYIKSDLIVVGKIGKPGKWIAQPRAQDENENYQRYLRLTPVQIDETIKGAAPKNLMIQENQSLWIDRSQEQKPQTPGVVKAPGEPEFYSSLPHNTSRRLFFFNADTEGGSHYFEIYTGRRFEPSQQALPVYISRLRELHAIYTVPSAPKQMIVEWLVAMAEDPVTRFEGAYELRQALYRYSEEEEEEEESGESEQADAPSDDAENAEDKGEAKDANENGAEKPVTADVVQAGENTVSQETIASLTKNLSVYSDLEQDHFDIVKLLTPNQKERLIQAFFNTRFTYKEAEKTAPDEDAADAEDAEEDGPPRIAYESVLSEEDTLLLYAVGEFKDRRVIDRLIAELPSINKHGPREAYGMIGVISEYFDDEKLEKLADKYSDVYWGDDNELIKDEAAAYDLPADDLPADDAEPADIAIKTEEEIKESKAVQEARDEAYVPSVTYAQRRAALIAQILARCAELGSRKEGKIRGIEGRKRKRGKSLSFFLPLPLPFLPIP